MSIGPLAASCIRRMRCRFSSLMAAGVVSGLRLAAAVGRPAAPLSGAGLLLRAGPVPLGLSSALRRLVSGRPVRSLVCMTLPPFFQIILVNICASHVSVPYMPKRPCTPRYASTQKIRLTAENTATIFFSFHPHISK